MTLKEKLEIFKDKGYTYDKETGLIKSNYGTIKQQINNYGYIRFGTSIRISNRKYVTINISAHQFAWYICYNEVPDMIDHKDRNRSNNKIENLRITTPQKNMFNTNAKGFFKIKGRDKYYSQIYLNRKRIYLGEYNTPEEAHNAYLEAKKIYH